VNGVPATYTYLKNGANPLNGQRLSSDAVNAYTWDSNGSNLTRNGTPGNFTFGYNVDNRLNAILGAATAAYTYDYQGRRTSKTVSGTTTTYLYDGLNLVGEMTGGTISNYAFGPGIDEPLIVNRAGTISFFNADGLASVAGTNNAAGTYDYSSVSDAWGSVRSETGTRTNSFTYSGRETGEAGLHFYRARLLQPGVGRFTQEDPLRAIPPYGVGLETFGRKSAKSGRDPLRMTFFNKRIIHVLRRGLPRSFSAPATEHVFTYADNNPLHYVDPLGLIPQVPGCDPPFPHCLEYPSVRECCDKHDECYEDNDCDQTSWLGFAHNANCFLCNAQAALCIVKALGWDLATGSYE